MLRPRKNPLVDGKLVVSTKRQVHGWRWFAAALLASLLIAIYLWPTPPRQGEVPDEVWWRRLISKVALERFKSSVDSSALEEMKQRLAKVEADRQSLSERLAESERLLRNDRTNRRLEQVVATRSPGGETQYEILLRTPQGATRDAELLVDLVAVNDLDFERTAPKAGSPMASASGAARLAVRAPSVAETLQGRLPSSARHLLVVVTPKGRPGEAEAAIVPVKGAPR